MSGLELFAAAIGVIAVWLTVKQNPWCWPIGLVMVVIYIWIFFDVKLYSDMLLQVIYAGLQVYGWLQWTRHGDGLPVKAVTTLRN
ncbi:nicotinamide riboside transporter PnuC, partial [Pseudomonas syringae]|uniref:nicotinamide riboside transporter PnuC n=1 Tax=Pseudomonas syringae TaxID=317 RepID=UPI001F46179A